MITTRLIPEGSCDGYGAAPTGTLILLILIVLSMYTGVVSCKLKPLLQVIPNMPGAQVVGTNAQVQIVTQPGGAGGTTHNCDCLCRESCLMRCESCLCFCRFRARSSCVAGQGAGMCQMNGIPGD